MESAAAECEVLFARALKPTWRPVVPDTARDDCTLCHGTGWRLATEAGLALAKRCPCAQLVRTVRVKDHVKIPQRYMHCGLSNFEARTVTQARALEGARHFAEHYPNVSRGLVFAGDSGSGKTHLCVGILLELVRRLHEDLLFVDFPALADAAGTGREATLQRKGELARLKLVSLLVLDNFGLVEPGQEALALATEILEARVRGHRPTLLSGEWLHFGGASEYGRSAEASQTQRFMEALPPALLWRFLATVRILPVRAPSEDRHGEGESLFGKRIAGR